MLRVKKESQAASAAFAKAHAKLDEDQKTVQARSKEGAVTLECIFIGNMPAGKGKGKAAATAIAGQGNGGGGGAAKKDPPIVMQVIPSVRSLAANVSPNAEYKVVNATTIAFPARSNQDMKKARDALKAANGAKAAAIAKGDKEAEKRESENVLMAEANLQSASTIVDWFHVRDGEPTRVKTFEQGAARGLKPLDKVNLAGVEADASMYEGRFSVTLSCSQPVSCASDQSPYVTLMGMTDLEQQAVCLPDPSLQYGPTRLLLFSNYERSAEDVELGRGCVELKKLDNSTDEKDYKIVKDKEEDRLKATYRLWQRQDGTLEGHPKGDYSILAVFLEGGWSQEEQMTRNTLRKGFGINKASKFAPIMANNNIPAVIACSLNVKDSAKQNAGRNHRTDNGTLVCWGNAAYFCLREYLLTQCAQVSLNYVRRLFNLPPDGLVYLQNEDPERPCQLNRSNLIKKGNQFILQGNKVLNLDEYSGNLTALLAANPKPCQFRVLHSAPTDLETRLTLASLSTDQAERVFNNEMNAPVRLVGQNIVSLVYLVEVMDEAEQTLYQEAEDSWKVRAERAAAAAQANEEAAMVAALDAAEGRMDLAEDEEPPVAPADMPVAVAVQEDNADEEAEAEALRIQEEEAARAKKRVSAPVSEESETGGSAKKSAPKKRGVVRSRKA